MFQSVVDVEKLIWEGREDHLCIKKKLKEYSDRNLKDKLWYEVYESVVTNWSELPAEKEIRKMYVNFLVHIIGDHANDANILGRSVHTIKKNTEALVIASKENGLEVNVGKTKYMVMSREKNAGQIHVIKTDNSSFERVEQFRYLGTTLRNQNSIREENKCRLKSQNACYHSVQNTVFKTAH
jgi:hypothetical protein